MKRLRQWFDGFDLRELMFFVLLFLSSGCGGFLGAWLAMSVGS